MQTFSFGSWLNAFETQQNKGIEKYLVMQCTRLSLTSNNYEWQIVWMNGISLKRDNQGNPTSRSSFSRPESF
jgi:hypothetical protein